MRELGKRGVKKRQETMNVLRNKRGAEKYYLIVSIILGLILLIIGIYWIFQEYFAEDLNRETCRQSIILRASMPESERLATRTLEKLRDNFPLKCKTEVVEVNIPEKMDLYFPKNVSALIAQKMNECWSLFGEGKYLVFPIKGLTGGARKNCVPCARIHFPAEAEKIPEEYSVAEVKHYMYTHYVGGKEIPDTKAISKTEILEGGKVFILYNDVENSYAVYFNYIGGEQSNDKTLFPLENDWDYNSKTGRTAIDVRKGDIIIGFYSFADTELVLNWPIIESSRWMRPFYAQIGVDNLDDCSFDGVPA